MDKQGYMRTCGKCNGIDIGGKIRHRRNCEYLKKEYRYECDGCRNIIPELQVDEVEGFRHHTIGEKNPEPCGPIRKVEINIFIYDDPPKPWKGSGLDEAV